MTSVTRLARIMVEQFLQTFSRYRIPTATRAICGYARNSALNAIQQDSPQTAFFIKMLTDEDDVVLDIFGGSNTTGFTAEALRRKWITFEINQDYLSSSAIRFLDGQCSATMKRVLEELSKSDANYFMNKAACALNPSNKAKSKVESKAQGELFAFGAAAL
jgi:hypothetical protein